MAQNRLAQKTATTPTTAEVDGVNTEQELADGIPTLDVKPKPHCKWGKGALTIVVWDHQENGDEPAQFYSQSAYPNIVSFDIWQPGKCHQLQNDMGDYQALLTLLIDDESTHDHGAIRVRTTTRFVSVLQAGQIPKSKFTLNGVLRLPDLLEQVEKGWPTARKVLFGIPARRRWEVYIRPKRTQ